MYVLTSCPDLGLEENHVDLITVGVAVGEVPILAGTAGDASD